MRSPEEKQAVSQSLLRETDEESDRNSLRQERIRNASDDNHSSLKREANRRPDINNPFQKQELKRTARGGIGDGGGSAVACFYLNKLTPNFPAETKDAFGRLTPHYRQFMNRLSVTDVMDFSASQDVRHRGRDLSVKPEAGETPEAYLDRVAIKRVQPLAPRFASMLKIALHSVRRELWIPVPEGLPDLPDQGLTPYLQEERRKECTSVQLIRRRESYDPVSGLSKVMAVEYDPDLLEKLQTVNITSWGPAWITHQIATLLLHEALYSMATSLGHTNSVKVRALTKVLLEENFSTAIKSDFQFLYLLYAHDFLNSSYFGYNPEIHPENSEEFNRLVSFGEILKKVAERARAVLKGQGFDCDTFEQQWPDLNCKIQGLQNAMNTYDSFFQRYSAVYFLYSEEELERFSDVFSFLWTAPSGNDREIRFMLERNSAEQPDSNWPETMLERFLMKESDATAIMKSVCPVVRGRMEANSQARGPWFARNPSPQLKLQDLFLRKAVRYCQSKSAL